MNAANEAALLDLQLAAANLRLQVATQDRAIARKAALVQKLDDLRAAVLSIQLNPPAAPEMADDDVMLVAYPWDWNHSAIGSRGKALNLYPMQFKQWVVDARVKARTAAAVPVLWRHGQNSAIGRIWGAATDEHGVRTGLRIRRDLAGAELLGQASRGELGCSFRLLRPDAEHPLEVLELSLTPSEKAAHPGTCVRVWGTVPPDAPQPYVKESATW